MFTKISYFNIALAFIIIFPMFFFYPSKKVIINTNFEWVSTGKYPFFELLENLGNNSNIPIENAAEISRSQSEIYSNNSIHSNTSSDANCYTKKRLIIDVSKSGMGNRLLAVVSAIIYSISMDRTLELIWERTSSCNASFDELFKPKEVAGIYYPFIHSGNKFKVKYLVEQVKNICNVRFDQNYFINLQLIHDKELFERFEQNCDVIYIKSNQFWGHLILNHEFNPRIEYIKKIFHSPFSHISKIVFRPENIITNKINAIKKLMKGKTFLSIHARGFYESGKGVRKIFLCANKLLAEKKISYILFITDKHELAQLARTLVSRNDSLIIPVKEEVIGERDSMSIRDEMDTAVAEWYIIGEADYCMSPTIGVSTFSTSAIVRGKCKYLNIHLKDRCTVEDFNLHKESLFYESNRHLTSELGPLNSTERNLIWDNVIISKENISQQCFNYNNSDKHIEKYTNGKLLSYWKE